MPLSHLPRRLVARCTDLLIAGLFFTAVHLPLLSANDSYIEQAGTELEAKVWTKSDGLPSARIQAITQTADGYRWVGTSRGLARFDGFSFHCFR